MYLYVYPVPTPRGHVKKLVNQYEENIILPSIEFRDDYQPKTPIPAPRTKKPVVEKPIPAPRPKKPVVERPIPAPRLKKPIPATRTKITQKRKALLNGYTKSIEVDIRNEADLLKQLTESELPVERYLLKQLNEMISFKFVVTLAVTFEKNSGDNKIIKTAYINSSPETVLNDSDVDLDLPIENIMNKIQI